MKKKHVKSPCCKGSVQRHGERRRQCMTCGKTWRIRKKKRGRKCLRVSANLASQFLDQTIPSLRKLAEKRGCPRENLRRRLEKSMDILVRQSSWQPVPRDVKLVAIADAMIERILGVEYTAYVILVKPVGSTQAIICSPYITQGHEDLQGWMKAFKTLSDNVKGQICALVCDGHFGLRGVAIEFQWLLQRCHFHLLLGLTNYVSSTVLSRRKHFSFLVHSSVKTILYTCSNEQLRRNIRHLNGLLMLTSSRGAHRVIDGFLGHVHEFRTYLAYPELHLPITSNSAESLVQCIRNILYETRGFRSEKAFKKWVGAILIHKQSIRCRGFDQPN